MLGCNAGLEEEPDRGGGEQGEGGYLAEEDDGGELEEGVGGQKYHTWSSGH